MSLSEDITEHYSGTTILHEDVVIAPKRSWRTWLIGNPLSTADAPHQTIGKAVGLAVFASDALSSTAYATQEILVILAAAGTAAFGFVMPISIAIITLLAIVTISYEQTIHAYPNGGGAYIVTRDNLGEFPALATAAALLTDYILTVAVSISSSVAQITSAFPDLIPYRVFIAIGMVMFIMLMNLRGVKESGTAFAIPTYFFVLMMFITVGLGIFKALSGTLGTVVDPPPLEMFGETAVVGAFLILHAFSSGTTALTGIEAISDGITAFREPRSRNAGITLIWMAAILGTLFLGISFLATQIHAVPSAEETVISQLARTIFNGRNVLYLMLISATTVILVMAANTAFADFPRLGAIAAADGYLPRQLTYRGSRLVYSRGILTLAVLASVLIFVFQASVTALIPLYAIGVFLSFTFSQLGMARRWKKTGTIQEGQEIKERGSVLHYDRNWIIKMVINGFGAVCTAVVMMVFAVTKFRDGAWVVLVLIPLLVAVFFSIHRHYANLAKNLTLEDYSPPLAIRRHRVLLLVSNVHKGTLHALNYARELSHDVTAVHVSLDPEQSKKVIERWEQWGGGVRLVVIESPYRLLIEPLLEYIDKLDKSRQPNDILTVVVPQFVPERWWTNALHANTALWLRMTLFFKPRIVVTEVPYQVRELTSKANKS